MNKNRLEAFSDGVLAIIITIMVLEIKIPDSVEWSALQSVLPVLGSYTFSFVYIGIYWGNHHHLMHTVKYITPGMIWANMGLLFCLSLVPVATGWMGNTHFAPRATALYAVLLLLCGVAFTILQLTILSTNQLSKALVEAFASVKRKGIVSMVLYAAAVPLAYVNPLISLVCFAIVSVMWIVPDRHIERALRGE